MVHLKMVYLADVNSLKKFIWTHNHVIKTASRPQTPTYSLCLHAQIYYLNFIITSLTLTAATPSHHNHYILKLFEKGCAQC